MRFAAVSLAAATVVAAQNATLIPSGISTECTTFLNKLNNDSSLASCVQPLINATASFSPASTAEITASDINYVLGDICKSSKGCSGDTIRSWLSQFYSACQSELTSSTSYNSQVRELYDILYVVNPLQGAICAVDSANQNYCVTEILNSTSSSTTSSSSSEAVSASDSASTNSTKLFTSYAAAANILSPISFAAEHLYIQLSSASSSITKRMIELLSARGTNAQLSSIITPNTTTYRNTNLPFLFLQPSFTSSQLCTPCTREVFVTYIKWESKQPYALGLSQSPILGGQTTLWNAINSTCGSAYVNAITSEVGTFSNSGSSSGAFNLAIPSALAVTIVSALGFAIVA